MIDAILLTKNLKLVLKIPDQMWVKTKEVYLTLATDASFVEEVDRRDDSFRLKMYRSWFHDWRLRTFLNEILPAYREAHPGAPFSTSGKITLAEGITREYRQIVIRFTKPTEQPNLTDDEDSC